MSRQDCSTMVQGVEVAGLDAGVGTLAEVDDIALGQRHLVAAQLGAKEVEALILPVREDVLRTLERLLLGHGSEGRARTGRAGFRDGPGHARDALLRHALRAAGGRHLAGLLGHHGQLRQDERVPWIDPVSVRDVLVLVPDLGPQVWGLQVAACDVPERVAAHDHVVGRAFGDGGRKGRVLRPVGSDGRRSRLEARRRFLSEDQSPGQHECHETSQHEIRSHCLSSRTDPPRPTEPSLSPTEAQALADGIRKKGFSSRGVRAFPQK
jgi:hypothetical protein